MCSLRGYYNVATPCMAIPCVAFPYMAILAIPCVAILAIPCVAILAIPCMANGKLHETCMFHAMRKHDLRKHVMGISCGTTFGHARKNEVIIEWYCMELIGASVNYSGNSLREEHTYQPYTEHQ